MTFVVSTGSDSAPQHVRAPFHPAALLLTWARIRLYSWSVTGGRKVFYIISFIRIHKIYFWHFSTIHFTINIHFRLYVNTS